MARVLLIDDDPLVLEALSNHLARDGHEVLRARDGREGVDTFRAEGADVVVTDLLMPTKEGLETIMEIRDLSASVVIIAISGGGQNSPIDLLDFARKVGANVILKKPFSATHFRRLVAVSLDPITFQ
jgi:DNA-binding response OmpR family regulator